MRRVLISLAFLTASSTASAGFLQDPEGFVEPVPQQECGFMLEYPWRSACAVPLEGKGMREHAGGQTSITDELIEMLSLVWAS